MTKKPTDSKLTVRERTFCEHYAIHRKPLAAYKVAGYSTNSTDETYNSRKAQEILRKEKIQAAIEEIRAEQCQRAQLKADDILAQWKAIGYSDITDVIEFGDFGYIIKDSKSLPKHVTQAIKSIDCRTIVTQKGTEHHTKITLHDKLGALNSMAKHLGMLSDLNEALNTLRKYGYAVALDNDQLYWEKISA